MSFNFSIFNLFPYILKIDKPVTNLRITGQGSFNGNGWETDQVLEDEVGNEMPIYFKGDSNDYL